MLSLALRKGKDDEEILHLGPRLRTSSSCQVVPFRSHRLYLSRTSDNPVGKSLESWLVTSQRQKLHLSLRPGSGAGQVERLGRFRGLDWLGKTNMGLLCSEKG